MEGRVSTLQSLLNYGSVFLFTFLFSYQGSMGSLVTGYVHSTLHAGFQLNMALSILHTAPNKMGIFYFMVLVLFFPAGLSPPASANEV